MAFHINFEGKVGKCTATQACPFGSFETDHYTTAEQAQVAYELSMEGKSVAKAHRKETFFRKRAEVRSEEQERQAAEYEGARKAAAEAAEAEREAVEKFEKYLRKMKAPKTKIPALPEPGYFKTVYGPEEGYVDEQGREALHVERVFDANGREVAVGIKWRTVEGKTEDETIRVEEAEARQVWAEEHSPEVLDAHRAAVRERNAEDFYLNYMRFPLSWAVAMQQRKDYEENLWTRFRVFKEKAKEFRKSGISSPFTRALVAAENLELPQRKWHVDQSPGGLASRNTQALLRYAVTGEGYGELSARKDLPEDPEHLYPGVKQTLKRTFLAHHVPGVDVNPRENLRLREERGWA